MEENLEQLKVFSDGAAFIVREKIQELRTVSNKVLLL
jgi:hypothetical protein